MGIKDILQKNNIPVPQSLDKPTPEPAANPDQKPVEQEIIAPTEPKSGAMVQSSGSLTSPAKASYGAAMAPIQTGDDGMGELKQLLGNFVSVQDLNFLIEYAKKAFGEQGMAKAKLWGIGIKALTKAFSSVKSKQEDDRHDVGGKMGFPADYYVC